MTSANQQEWGKRMSIYRRVYDAWRTEPETFWATVAAEIDWFTPWDKVFEGEAGVYGRWFVGATTNTCFNALDRHVERGRAEQTAIIYDSPVTDVKRAISYREMLAEV